LAPIAVGLGYLGEPTPDPASPEREILIRVGLPTPSPTNSVEIVITTSTQMPEPSQPPTATSTVPAPTLYDPRESTFGLSITNFDQQSITVRPKTTVIWTNAGFNAHTVIQGLPFGGISH